MTALSVPRSPPHSGVFIAVVAGCRWTPLSSLSEVLPLLAAEVDQVGSLSGVRPSSLYLLLAGCVQLKISKFGRSFTVPWIRYPRYTPW